MEAIQKTKELPQWIDSFINAFSNSSQHQRELEHEAEINVKSLPKVVWNDDTFYVSLDKETACADIFNTYGNVATTLKNVSSIEDVEKSLNKKVIAASNDQDTLIKDSINVHPINEQYTEKKNVTLDDELPKIAEQLGLQAAASIQDIEATAIQTLRDDNSSNNLSDNNALMNSNSTDKYAAHVLSAKLTQVTKHAEHIQEELNTYKKKFTKLANSLNKLSNIVNNLADQMYAHTNPGNVYDIGAAATEIQHFNNTAQNTAKEILIEHSVDLTQPQGRTSLQDRILNDINNIQLPMDFVKEVKPTIDDKDTNKNVEVVADDTSDNISDQTTKVNKSVVNTSADKSRNNKLVQDERTINTSQPQVNINVAVELPEDKKLLGKSAALFKQQICPICHQRALRLSTKTPNMQNVICKKCNSLFGVDLSTEDIFKQ